MEWAQETDDDLMTSYVLFRKSNQATAHRNPQQAVSLARVSQRVPGVTAKVRALAAQQEAQGHALMGNPRFAQTKARADAELESTGAEDMHGGELEVSLLLHGAAHLVRDGFENGDHSVSARPHLLTPVP